MTNDNFSQNQALAAMNCQVSGLNYQYNMQAGGISGASNTLWNYWTHDYYPQVILQSYPVYYREKAMDKGKQAFEILKSLMDKKLVKLDKVSDFVEAMDTILKTL